MKNKKIILMLLCTIFLASCGNEKNPEESKMPEATNTPEASQNPPQEEKQPETKQPVKESEKPKEETVASYKTPIKDYKKERLTNIKVATKAINGKVINPGEEFSFNKIVGERTEKKGYKKAIIFVGEEKVEGIGGGICQISTTLFQVAKKAGMKITERHEHKAEVNYIKKGEDATVNYPDLDFRFVNTKDYPVKIVVALQKNDYVASIIKIND